MTKKVLLYNADGTEVCLPYTDNIPTASDTQLGGVRIDGETITVDDNGVISSNGGSDLSNYYTKEETVEVINNLVPTTPTNWVQTELPSSSSWASVAFGNGRFVSLASNVSIYSDDGINWTKNDFESGVWRSVVYGDGKFVAVCSGTTKAAYSEDGINWTITTLPSKSSWCSVAYGNGRFVATTLYGSTSKAAYSEDGINWVESELSETYTDRYSVTYGNGKFVTVCGNSKVVLYSEDGITWTQGTLPVWENLRTVTYGDGKFVAVGYNSANAEYSNDGITWTQTELPVSAYWHSVTYGDGKFVAVAYNSDVLAYSDDGINWTQGTLPVSSYWISVTYGNNKYVALTTSSDISAYCETGLASALSSKADKSDIPDISNLATKEEVETKVDKVDGKSLVDDTEIERLSSVVNYDDTTVKSDITDLQNNKADKTDLSDLSDEVTSNMADIAENKKNIQTNTDNITSLTSTIDGKQDKLVSGTSIKTINSTSLLGSGDISVPTIKDVEDVTMTMLEAIYPVGSIYLTINSTCPLVSLFGEWELVSSGNALWTGDGTNANTFKSAGLPNITGTVGAWQLGTNKCDGAFTYASFGSQSYGGSNTTEQRKGATFDASDSNSIYGNSSTVQPPAYVVNVYRRIA